MNLYPHATSIYDAGDDSSEKYLVEVGFSSLGWAPQYYNAYNSQLVLAGYLRVVRVHVITAATHYIWKNAKRV
jgi:hypothetical protein